MCTRYGGLPYPPPIFDPKITVEPEPLLRLAVVLLLLAFGVLGLERGREPFLDHFVQILEQDWRLWARLWVVVWPRFGGVGFGLGLLVLGLLGLALFGLLLWPGFFGLLLPATPV